MLIPWSPITQVPFVAQPLGNNVVAGVTEFILHAPDLGAEIFYTLDNTTPTVLSTPYIKPFIIQTSPFILGMVAKVPGMVVSDPVFIGYSPPQQTATPVILPAAGAVFDNTPITITCSTPGSTIRYTTDGTIPTGSSTLYTGAFVLPVGNRTVVAIGITSGYVNSALASTPYTVTAPIALLGGVVNYQSIASQVFTGHTNVGDTPKTSITFGMPTAQVVGSGVNLCEGSIVGGFLNLLDCKTNQSWSVSVSSLVDTVYAITSLGDNSFSIMCRSLTNTFRVLRVSAGVLVSNIALPTVGANLNVDQGNRSLTYIGGRLLAFYSPSNTTTSATIAAYSDNLGDTWTMSYQSNNSAPDANQPFQLFNSVSIAKTTGVLWATIQFVPTSPSVLILRSTDNGTTWTQLRPPGSSYYAYSHTVAGGIFVLGSQNGPITQSYFVDDNLTITVVDTVSINYGQAMGVDKNYIYVGAVAGSCWRIDRVTRTIISGETWPAAASKFLYLSPQGTSLKTL